MDKNAIKKFAINSRKELLDMVRQRAGLFGITGDGISDKLSMSTNEIEYYVDDKMPLVGKDIQKRRKLVEELKTRAKKSDYQTAFTDLMEEVAYTWFNRIVAIRFMEVNDYLPSRTRVLSSTQNRNEPDIMINPLDLEVDLGAFSDDDKQLINEAWETEDPIKMDELYKMLFIKQVNALNKNLPYLFEKTNDYAELLFTPNYNRGVIKSIVTDIDEVDFDVSQGGQVEIIGWIYQYYNTELKDIVLKKNKYNESDIPAVTQLFTPDWIVKYLVENSLGRYWINILHAKGNNKQSKEIANDFGWNYFMPATTQNKDVQINISNKEQSLSDTNIDDITLMDPAMGSGHILVYAFEVFMQIYLSEGYSKRDAAKFILENNLFGLDIDTRAFQLAYFSIMMKARNYNRRILTSDLVPNVYDIPEYRELDYHEFEKIVTPSNLNTIKSIVESFKYGNDYGSLISTPGKVDWDGLMNLEKTIESGQMSFGTINFENDVSKLEEIIRIAKLLSSKYTINVTNPPYMGSGKMNSQLSKYVKNNFPDSKADMFAIFIERTKELTQNNGYYALITQHSWMFLSSFEKLRNKLNTDTLINMAHLGTRAFEDIGGEVVQSTAFVMQNVHLDNYVGTYERLVDFDSQDKKETAYLNAVKDNDVKYLYRTNQANFNKIPGSPIAYWANKLIVDIFLNNAELGDYAEPRQGMATSNNKRFLREWYEEEINNIEFGASDKLEAKKSNKKWFPYNKGGSFRKWYGNNSLIVNWANEGSEIMKLATTLYKSPTRTIKNIPYYFRNGLTWSALSSGDISFRYTPTGFLFDSKGPMLFIDKNNSIVNYFYLLSFLNSKVVMSLLKILAPTLDFNQGPMRRLPLIVKNTETLQKNVKLNIKLSKNDWDSFETSWDFHRHPLLNHIADDKRTEVDGKVENAFNIWKSEAQDRFDQLKSNEEELNKIFIDLYGLQDELTPEVADKDVSVRLADEERDIKSFLSYFIGVVFGRYSLDTDGLAFAGGEWDASKYKSFVPNDDNLLMLNDAKYFDDERDIINRLKEFLTVTFGKETLSDNLEYIASVVGKKADNDEDSIRRYFVEDFFKDHKKIYQKRPIYWEFSSGKANGFKALMYLHRYDENELAMIRTNYLHPLQGKYETGLSQLNQFIDVETVTKNKKKLEKEFNHVTKQLSEIKKYDAVIQHLANEKISLDLDDGVVVNYEKLQNGEKILSKYN